MVFIWAARCGGEVTNHGAARGPSNLHGLQSTLHVGTRPYVLAVLCRVHNASEDRNSRPRVSFVIAVIKCVAMGSVRSSTFPLI